MVSKALKLIRKPNLGSIKISHGLKKNLFKIKRLKRKFLKPDRLRAKMFEARVRLELKAKTLLRLKAQ